MTDPDFNEHHRDPGGSAGEGPNVSGGALSAIGEPVAGTDARPDDLFPDLERTFAPKTADADDSQGGANAEEDARRAHAAAQGSEGQATRGLDDTRASAELGSINDNDAL